MLGTAAQTTLYIPGFDPQPITADVLGVGADGQTTWLLGPGVSSGALDDIGLPGPGKNQSISLSRWPVYSQVHAPATLIEGPSAAKLVFDSPAASMLFEDDCTIVDGIATCTVVVALDGTTSTGTAIETVVPFTVQGGGSSVSPTSAPSAGSGASSGASPTPSSGASNSGSQTASSSGSSSSGAPAPTQTTNDVGKLQSGTVTSVLAVGMSLVMLFALL